MNIVTLYHQGKKGEMREWSCWTEGNEIITEYGMSGGELQYASKYVYAKNVGRSNETGDDEQADLEARSMVQAKLDRKYSTTKAGAKEIRIRPMLAHSWEKHKHKLTYPVDVQPKLDGVRCLAMWQDGKILLLSRSGKEYTIPHIAEELATFLPKNTILDGEVYIHGIPFQKFMSLVKKNRPESSALKYVIYDAIMDYPWEHRREYLLDLWKKRTNKNKVTLLKTFSANNEDSVLSIQKRAINAGYEGAIVRALDGEYRIGYRSNKLLKVKTFDDAEFQIVDFTEGVGKMAGAVIWVCVTKSGKTFKVVPIGTMEERRAWFNNGWEYMGDMLTVKYFGKSEDGIPRFPIGKGIR